MAELNSTLQPKDSPIDRHKGAKSGYKFDEEYERASVSNTKMGTFTADKIVAGTIDASVITVTNLDAGNITTGSISANYLSGGTIDAQNIAVINLNASNITSGTITANIITGGTINADNVKVTNIDADNITTGKIDSNNGKTYFDLDNNEIVLSDGTNPRVVLIS